MGSRDEGSKNQNWQGFVYMGESANRGRDDINEKNLAESFGINEADAPDNSTFSLATAKVGDRLRLVSLNCGEANNRLMGMGLIPGTQLEIVSATATGSAIVAFNDNRLGLGADMAQQIRVTLADATKRTVKTMNETTGKPAIKLGEAAIGSTLKVVAYAEGSRDYKRKLLAMGLTPGTEFVVKRHAPLGDPTEIELRGFHLTLRKAEAEALIVELA